MNLYWPWMPWYSGATYWMWIQALPILVGLCCAILLFRRGATRAIAVGLAGAFCVEVWKLALSFVGDTLAAAGVFQMNRPAAWKAAYALVPVAWWVGCWIYIGYRTMRLFGDSTSKPFCPVCRTTLLPSASECPKCKKGVAITVREIAVPVS